MLSFFCFPFSFLGFFFFLFLGLFTRLLRFLRRRHRQPQRNQREPGRRRRRRFTVRYYGLIRTNKDTHAPGPSEEGGEESTPRGGGRQQRQQIHRAQTKRACKEKIWRDSRPCLVIKQLSRKCEFLHENCLGICRLLCDVLLLSCFP